MRGSGGYSREAQFERAGRRFLSVCISVCTRVVGCSWRIDGKDSREMGEGKEKASYKFKLNQSNHHSEYIAVIESCLS